jgi:hypothetical protein
MKPIPASPQPREGREVPAGGRRNRRGVLVATAAVACLAAGGVSLGVALSSQTQPPPQPGPAVAGVIAPTRAAPTQSGRTTPAGRASTGSMSPTNPRVQAVGPLLPASTPTSLSIPTIGVHTGLLELGENSDGTIQVPWQPLEAGWFRYSPTPGQLGPAVILGHVDSYQTGPAVFYRLGALQPGQSLTVGRADGRQAVFTITAVREYSKAAFPTETVYGNTDYAGLRLITCGDWNSSTHEYDGNIVVFAHLNG